MKIHVRALALAVTAGAVLATVVSTSLAAKGPPVATYEVTIRNLTAGQPFTPPVVATHRAATGIFQVGSAATVGLKEIAENGDLAPMIASLAADKHVLGTAVGSAPLVPGGLPGSAMFPDDSVTLTVTAMTGAKFLSFASMLVCTNDGFTGLDSLRLPKQVGDVVTVSTAAYDAGTELNTEDYADIVPPCQGLHGVAVEPGTGTSNPALAEGGVIHHHPGIAGGVDLTGAAHGWSDPVAEVTVERIS